MLFDQDIRLAMKRGQITIDPKPPDQHMQPASVDLTLGKHFTEFPSLDELIKKPGQMYPLAPGQCLLATTAERIGLGAQHAAIVDGKSTWGRQFLLIHCTAGFLDPGFEGDVTLELKNLSSEVILLPVGIKIAQVRFFKGDSPATRTYGNPQLGSHYQGQRGATPAARDDEDE